MFDHVFFGQDHRHGRRAFLGAALAIAGAALALPALAADEAALVQAAKAEGSGILYSNIDPALTQSVVSAFKQKYGIDVDVQRLTSGALSQRFATEAESGNMVADAIISTDPTFMETASQKGWLVPTSEIPAAAALPENARKPNYVVAAHVPYSLVWNTSIVDPAPQGWQDLIDPKWKGRVMVVDPRNSLSAAQWYSMVRRVYGDDFLRKLGAQAKFSPSAVPGLQQVAAGAMAIYAPALHQIVVGLKEKGAPLGEAFIEPTLSSDNLAAAAAKAPHPNVGRLLIDFVLSVEGQALLNKDGFSPLTGVPGTRPLPKLNPTDPEAVRKEVPEIAALLGLG